MGDRQNKDPAKNTMDERMENKRSDKRITIGVVFAGILGGLATLFSGFPGTIFEYYFRNANTSVEDDPEKTKSNEVTEELPRPTRIDGPKPIEEAKVDPVIFSDRTLQSLCGNTVQVSAKAFRDPSSGNYTAVIVTKHGSKSESWKMPPDRNVQIGDNCVISHARPVEIQPLQWGAQVFVRMN
jgi:hypothetical protein